MAAACWLAVTLPPRILFVLDSFPDPSAGGTERQFWLLYEGLRDRGLKVRVVLLRESPFLTARMPAGDFEILGIRRVASLRAIRIALATAWRARRSRVRVAHVVFTDSSLLFPIVFWLFGVRTVLSRRDLGFSYSRRELKLLRLNRPFVSRVVANCRAVKRAVLAQEGYSPARVDVIYNGLSAQNSSPDTQFRQRWNLDPASRLIVTVANIKPLKRLSDAITSLHLLRERIPAAVLVIVGEDRPGIELPSHRQELERHAMNLGVSAAVRFVGSLADPMSVVLIADVCLLCSETEGLSNTLMEYMAGARPVVCTDVGGNAELIVHVKTGLLVPVGDHRAMTAALLRLLEDRVWSEQMGRAAQVRVQELCSPGALVVAHETLYRRLAGSP
jgi:glycosyltransferase involved in cell wall biosynthesis